MSDYGGDDYETFYDDGEGDWLYVEDAWDEADELAEQTCPSPPLQSYIPDEDIDPFDYFIDLDYLSDGYYDDRADINLRRKAKRKLQQRRKAAASRSSTSRPAKRQRTGPSPPESGRGPWEHWDRPNIVYVSQHKRSRDPSFYVPTTRRVDLPAVALLKDWRERFEGHSGLSMRPVQQPAWHLDASAKTGVHSSMALRGSGVVEDDMGIEVTEGADDAEEGTEELELEGLKDIASMLTDGHKEKLLKMLAAKGIDPAALDMVMADLMEGKTREFEAEQEDESDDTGEDAEEAKRSLHESRASEQQPKVNGTSRYDRADDDLQHKPSKRKAGMMDFGEDDDGDDKKTTIAPKALPSKRGRSCAESAASSSSVAASNHATVKANGAGAKRKANDDDSTQVVQSKRSKDGEAAENESSVAARGFGKMGYTRGSRK